MESPALAHLADAWQPTNFGDYPHWTRVRAFVDHLLLHPERIAASIADPPPPSGSDRHDNLLAAIAEKLADDHQVARPAWVLNVEPLTDP